MPHCVALVNGQYMKSIFIHKKKQMLFLYTRNSRKLFSYIDIKLSFQLPYPRILIFLYTSSNIELQTLIAVQK